MPIETPSSEIFTRDDGHRAFSAVRALLMTV
jgi:hypothetical protein